jgi:para-nitrobenzyl esterase
MASIGALMRKSDPNTPELGAAWAPWPAQLRFSPHGAATLTASKIAAAP